MKIQREYLPELCVSNDSTRGIITKLNLVRQHKGVSGSEAYVVATNGHCLVVVPCLLEKGDVVGTVRSDVFREARRLRSCSEDKMVKVQMGKRWVRFVDGTIMPRKSTECPFPETSIVLPTSEPIAACRFGVNPKMLHDIAKSLGSETHVTIELHGDGPMLIRFENDGSKSLGAMMPED